jgi:hypothetical protein
MGIAPLPNITIERTAYKEGSKLIYGTEENEIQVNNFLQ